MKYRLECGGCEWGFNWRRGAIKDCDMMGIAERLVSHPEYSGRQFRVPRYLESIKGNY